MQISELGEQIVGLWLVVGVTTAKPSHYRDAESQQHQDRCEPQGRPRQGMTEQFSHEPDGRVARSNFSKRQTFAPKRQGPPNSTIMRLVKKRVQNGVRWAAEPWDWELRELGQDSKGGGGFLA
jgi:hypothetical protein